MKLIATVLLMIFSLAAMAQRRDTCGYIKANTTFGTDSINRQQVVKTFYFPTYSVAPSGTASLNSCNLGAMALYGDSVHKKLWVFNPIDSSWTDLTAGGGSALPLQGVTDLGNFTTDSINVISGTGKRMVSLISQNVFMANNQGVLRLQADAVSGYTQLAPALLTYTDGTNSNVLDFDNIPPSHVNTLSVPDTTGTIVTSINGTSPNTHGNVTLTIPATFNPIAGTNMTLSGSYPNITFNAGTTAANGSTNAVQLNDGSGNFIGSSAFVFNPTGDALVTNSGNYQYIIGGTYSVTAPGGYNVSTGSSPYYISSSGFGLTSTGGPIALSVTHTNTITLTNTDDGETISTNSDSSITLQAAGIKNVNISNGTSGQSGLSLGINSSSTPYVGTTLTLGVTSTGNVVPITGGGGVDSFWQGLGGGAVRNINTSTVNVIGQDNTNPTLVVTSASGQTANPFQIQNSSNYILSAIDTGGNLHLRNPIQNYSVGISFTSSGDSYNQPDIIEGENLNGLTNGMYSIYNTGIYFGNNSNFLGLDFKNNAYYLGDFQHSVNSTYISVNDNNSTDSLNAETTQVTNDLDVTDSISQDLFTSSLLKFNSVGTIVPAIPNVDYATTNYFTIDGSGGLSNNTGNQLTVNVHNTQPFTAIHIDSLGEHLDYLNDGTNTYLGHGLFADGSESNYATYNNTTYLRDSTGFNGEWRKNIANISGVHTAISIDSNVAVKIDNAYTLPTGDGSNGNVMITNGSGTLSWNTPSVPGINDVLGVGQSLTAAQNINTNSQAFSFIGGGIVAFTNVGVVINNANTGNFAGLDNTLLTAIRNFQFPDKDGTFALTSDVPIAASVSQSVTAVTTVTVTLPSTQANNTYKLNITPTSLLASTAFYVSAKTTTTFTVTYATAVTGAINFDYSLFQ